jgi:2-keto-3-deoxy-6-phosphogluconate aldolase
MSSSGEGMVPHLPSEVYIMATLFTTPSIITRVAAVVRDGQLAYFKGVVNVDGVAAVVDIQSADHFVFPAQTNKETLSKAKRLMGDLKLMREYANALVDSGMNSNELQTYLRNHYRAGGQIVIQ